jgi:DNA-binding protein HU-beta
LLTGDTAGGLRREINIDKTCHRATTNEQVRKPRLFDGDTSFDRLRDFALFASPPKLQIGISKGEAKSTLDELN